MKRAVRYDFNDKKMRVISSVLAASFFISGFSGLIRADEETSEETTFYSEEETTSSETLSAETEISEELFEVSVPDETDPTETLFSDEETETVVSEETTQDTTVQEGYESDDYEDTIDLISFEAVTDSGITVTAEAYEGVFPEDVTMVAEDIESIDVEENVTLTLGEDVEVMGMVAVDISFYDSFGNELEPDNNCFVSVYIELPDDIELEGEEYTIIHLDNDGEGVEIEDAEVTSTDAEFMTDSFSIFVVTATGDRDKDKIHAFLGNAVSNDLENQYGFIDNSENQPYLLPIGESIQLIGSVDDPGSNNLSISASNGNVSIVTDSASPSEVRVTVTGVSTGKVKLTLNGTGEEFWIDVRNKAVHQTRYIDMDQITSGTLPEVHVNLHDTIVITGTPGRYDYDGDWPYASTPENDNDKILTELGHSDPYTTSGTRSTTFIANRYDRNNNDEIITLWSNNGKKQVRIIVDNYERNAIDHADVEIADEGVYTSVSFELGDEGMVRTTTQYQAYVSNVNRCDLLGADRQPVFFYKHTAAYSNDLGWYTVSNVGLPQDKGCYTEDEYWTDPNHPYGDSQYEYTSKYYKEDTNGDGIFDTGYISNDKYFYLDDVQYARFDIDINVVTTKINKDRWDEATQSWVPMPEETLEYNVDLENGVYQQKVGDTYVTLDDPSTIMRTEPNVIFDLERDAVVDAYNKCPNHSGLDFTIHANSAMVQFEANKELLHADLQDGEFTFELVACDSNYEPLLDGSGNEIIEYTTNNAEGKVVFKTKHYESPGTYYYIIREKDESGTRTDIKFSDAVYKIMVEIVEVEGSGGMLTANVVEASNNYDFRFINEFKVYELPETGGAGTLPFYLTGLILIAAPLMVHSKQFIILNNNKNTKKGRKKKL